MKEVLHPDGSDCDYCTYDRPCITVVQPKTALAADIYTLEGKVSRSNDKGEL